MHGTPITGYKSYLISDNFYVCFESNSWRTFELSWQPGPCRSAVLVAGFLGSSRYWTISHPICDGDNTKPRNLVPSRRLRCRYVLGVIHDVFLRRLWTAACISMWPNEGTWRTLHVSMSLLNVWQHFPRNGSAFPTLEGDELPVSMVSCCTLLIRHISFLGSPSPGSDLQTWYNYPTCPYKPTDQPILLSSRWINWYKLLMCTNE